jgi:outer membrane immunogenic protein
MRRIQCALLAAVLVVGVASIASAADMPAKGPMYTKAPLAAPAISWTGFYIGGDVGGAWTTNTGTWTPFPSPAAFGVNIISGSNGGSGVTGGFHAGYNYQFAPTWVAGLEGDWSWAKARGSYTQLWTSSGVVVPLPGSFTTMSSRLDWMSSLRGRVGYLVTPALMAYATGGVAWARIDYAANNSNLVTYTTSAAASSTQTGFVVGGGLEWAMTHNWLVRAEYLYYSFNGAPSLVGTFVLSPGFPSGYSWSSTNVSVARAGLSYKF